MRSGNPALNEKAFEGLENHSSEVMTINGTVNKTSMLLAIVVITSLYTWSKAQSLDGPGAAIPLVLGGAIGALIVAFITIFKKPGHRLLLRFMPVWKVWRLAASPLSMKCSIRVSSCRLSH